MSHNYAIKHDTMNRPRKSTRKHWPDYLNARNKPAGLYYSWKHPHTGKEYGLGYSFQIAAAIRARRSSVNSPQNKQAFCANVACFYSKHTK